MIPHISLYEQLMLERVRKWQREAKQEPMLAGLWKLHHAIVRYLIGRLGIFFVAPETSMQHLEQPDQGTDGAGSLFDSYSRLVWLDTILDEYMHSHTTKGDI
jgi:hypothetical protein